jgi:DNA adenine methylase
MTAKPFLKWVGGKRSILPELRARMPDACPRYYEPFVGGGALFFDVRPSAATLSDANQRLIQTYTAVRDDLTGVLRQLSNHAANHGPDYYKEARVRLSAAADDTEVAALFIYLNKTCFNGLYRVNRANQFNVPMGSYKNPAIRDVEALTAASWALQGVEIAHRGFLDTPVVPQAFYYFDPPYHETFANYSSTGFSEDHHRQLAELCGVIAASGGHFLLSNSDTEFVRGLYAAFVIEEVAAMRSVSRVGSQRKRENELLIRNY